MVPPQGADNVFYDGDAAMAKRDGTAFARQTGEGQVDAPCPSAGLEPWSLTHTGARS
jgi:hypothetical protein